MTKFEKERKWTSVIHFHKKAIVNLQNAQLQHMHMTHTIQLHRHDLSTVLLHCPIMSTIP